MEGPYPGVTYDPEKAPFWPKMLRSTGYITAHIGKWHIGQDTGAGRDWDYQASWNRPKGSSSKPTYYYLDQEISFNGAPPVKVDGYATDNYTDWAEQFIRGENRPEDAPWFLWLTYTASHSPFIPAERHQGKYEHVEVPVPLDIYPPRPGKPFYMQQIRDWAEDESGQPQTNTGWAGGEGISLQTLGHQYHETVSAIDEGVGRLINALEETNQLSNTLIIFTSDQGYALGQHGFTRKVAPYDANIRAPLIVSLPGEVAEGKVVSEPVAGVDLIPTILRAASMDLPWRMDGRDLWPLLRQHKFEWSHPMLLTSTGWTYGDDTSPLPVDGMDGHSRLTGIPWYVMLRHDRFKYIRTLVPNEIEELYDLNLDPGEFFNLASRREFQTVLKKYRSMALDELGRTEAPFVDQLPDTKKFVPTIN
jgi:arylsulfatase A-like enzyme